MAAMRARQKIRAPRQRTGVTEQEAFEDAWTMISTSLTEIHTKNSSTISFENLYRKAYAVILGGRAEELAARVREHEETWVGGPLKKTVTDSISKFLLLAHDQSAPDLKDQSTERQAAGEKFLNALKTTWEDHHLCMCMITDVLLYMDRITAIDRRKPTIYAVAMAAFRDKVLGADLHTVNEEIQTTVMEVFKSTVLFMIRLEREGQLIERNLIKHCTVMLENLYQSTTEEEGSKIYLTDFEPAFLQASHDFYTAEGERLLETGDAVFFCRAVSQRISEEQERARTTLSKLSEPKILGLIDDVLIRQNIDQLVQLKGAGVKYMIDNAQMEALQIIYTLNTRVDKKKTALCTALTQRIVELGREINSSSILGPTSKPDNDTEKKNDKTKEKPVNQQTALAVKWVKDTLALKRQFDNIWKQAFFSDLVIEVAIMESFADFINMNSRCSEYLSLFFDDLLKKGNKDKTDLEIDALLEYGIVLLRFVKAKDLFETYYKRHLARRLLMKRSASVDMERSMISKMKVEVGNQFTQRIEAMFRDITISEDITRAYREYIFNMGGIDAGRIDLEMTVLTNTIWPLGESKLSGAEDDAGNRNCVYPREIESLKQSLEKFYLDKHSGRKLTWLASLGTADVRVNFKRSSGKIQRYELNVSTYAMVILLLFNDLEDGESLTYQDIENRTQIPKIDLIRNLQSLAVAPKTRILRKEPMSKDVKPTDKFFFNNEFQSQFVKVRINVVSGGANKAENTEQRQETDKKMSEERFGTIDSAIVRIMKQRRQLSHNQLISEVLAQLSARFVPDVDMIKKRIESLMDREYLERLPGSTYAYLA
ncbi:cullin-3 [Penicillium malachiteum]|nr:cullin-3 [Penicillium malachiteum]